MAILPFPEYRPDLNDLNQAYTAGVIQNVIPRGDGYGPINAVSAFAKPLPAACRGYFYARNRDGTVSIFGATATDLYLLSNITLSWTKVSQGGGPYTAVGVNAQWQFAQFNDFVIAVQANVNPQVYNLTSSTDFADLGGTPPKAAYIAIVNRFVVLMGLPSYPYRVQWCALNDPTSWSPGLNSSDFEDLPDGGTVRGMAGGELGFIFQDQAIRRMIFAPGSDVIFSIDKLHNDIGLLAPYSLLSTGENICFLSAKGFQRMTYDGALQAIGKERVDRFIANALDTGELQLMIGAGSPQSTQVFWSFKSTGYNGAGFDTLLVFDLVLSRWSLASINGEYITTLARPGLTLEAMDAIMPGAQAITGAADNGSGLIRLTVGSTAGWTTGQYKSVSDVGGVSAASGTWQITVVNATHIDLQGSTFSGAYTSGGVVGGTIEADSPVFDDISASTLPGLSIVDLTHTIGFFSGLPLEAIIETAEQSSYSERFSVMGGLFPDTDATVCFGSISMRENLRASPVYTAEQPMTAQGLIPHRVNTRAARARLRIPAGTPWTYARGVEPVRTAARGRR